MHVARTHYNGAIGLWLSEQGVHQLGSLPVSFIPRAKYSRVFNIKRVMPEGRSREGEVMLRLLRRLTLNQLSRLG